MENLMLPLKIRKDALASYALFLKSYQEMPATAVSSDLQRDNMIWAFNMAGIRPEGVAGIPQLVSSPEKKAYELIFTDTDEPKRLTFSMVFTEAIEPDDKIKIPNAETHFRMRVKSSLEPPDKIAHSIIEFNYTIARCREDDVELIPRSGAITRIMSVGIGGYPYWQTRYCNMIGFDSRGVATCIGEGSNPELNKYLGQDLQVIKRAAQIINQFQTR